MKKVKEYLIQNCNKVKINSKDIFRGDVFFALAGNNTHGNRYIVEAINNGAKYIITDIQPDKKLRSQKILLVKDTIKYLFKLATLKRNLFNGNVIGITGSVGKTSVKENLKYFLSPFIKISASIKSYNNFLGVIISLANIDLASDFAIFEMGTNNFSEIKELTSIIKPSQIIITNIFPTHLEKLISTRNIALEKADIFNPLYNPNVETAILPSDNIDEKMIIKLAKNQKIPNIFTFGKSSISSVKIINIIKINDDFIKILLHYKNQVYDFNLNRNQLYKINNVLICFLIFKHNNFNIDKFVSLTQHIPLQEGRGLHNKIIFNDKKLNFIDESYNASPKTMKICINYFNDLKIKKNQKKFLILGDMKELGHKALKFHIELLNYIDKKKLENVIICGELMRLALNKLENDKILFMFKVNSIIKYLKKTINDDDFIIVKGSHSSLTNQLSKELLKKGKLNV